MSLLYIAFILCHSCFFRVDYQVENSYVPADNVWKKMHIELLSQNLLECDYLHDSNKVYGDKQSNLSYK